MNHDNLSPTLPAAMNGASPLQGLGEDSDSDRDSSGSVSSMSSGEIESYFVERYNRRFYSPGNGRIGLYPLPVDDIEGQRSNLAHEVVKDLIGGRNYRSPIQQTLAAPVGGRRVRVLDVCTGNGKWVDEMAVEFPHTKVYGLDIVPLATRYPADNVQFEIHDINAPTRWVGGRFDLVHMRQVCLSAINYPAILHEVARILRPGGLFLAGEWMLGIYAEGGSGALPLSDSAAEFFRHLSDFAARRRLFCDPPSIPRMLGASAFYEDVVPERHFLPLDDSPRGERAKQALLEFGDAVQCFFLDSGISASQSEDILQTLRRDLVNANGFCLVYLTVHARRRAMV